MNGALVINKHQGITSFGVIEELQKQLMRKTGQKRRDLPKLGHGGTLDPFATGLLLVCCGRGVKLAQYFLGSQKIYRGVIRFGETTIPGDPTDPISETSDVIPESLDVIQKLAHQMTLQPYLQTPPMHSAKKKNGKPLYELARAGIEIERQPKKVQLFDFKVEKYEKPRAFIEVRCSSGTYIRTLAQDCSRLLGTVGMLDSLCRVGSGAFRLDKNSAMTLDEIGQATAAGATWDSLPCWIPFDRLLEGHPRAEATEDEAQALYYGRQNVLFDILKRADALADVDESETTHLAVYRAGQLIAIAARPPQGAWGLARVFLPETLS